MRGFAASYHELTADVDENAIILWALHLVSRFGFQRDEVRRTVRQAHRTLIGDVLARPPKSGRLYWPFLSSA